MTRHEKAIARLREILGPIEALGLDPKTEIIIPEWIPTLIGADAPLGGLGYHIKNRPGERVEIKHDGRDRFVIHTFRMIDTKGQMNEHTRLAVQATSKELRAAVKRIVFVL